MSKNLDTQIVAYNTPDSKPSCYRYGSTNLRSGAGLKPGEESRRCGDCGEFLGYQPIERLKRPKKRPKPGLEHISSILSRLDFGGGES